jgi:membrane-associated phospholipid phosphatase
VLLHEIVCGALLVSLWARLVWAAGAFTRDAALILLMLAANICVLVCWYVRPTSRRWALRLLYYPVAMNLLYPLLRTVVPAIHPTLEDAPLQSADSWLVGTNLSLAFQGAVRPTLTDFLSLCYLLYFVYLLFSQTWYFLGDREVLKRYYAGLFTIYGVGYLGYSLVPALGPYLAMANQFSVPLEGGWLTHLNAQIVANGSNHVDVFPSLHCGNSLYILMSDYQHKRWRFWAYLIPCAGFWVSTIYLRYHYVIDVICGFLLGWIAWKIANRKVRGAFA